MKYIFSILGLCLFLSLNGEARETYNEASFFKSGVATVKGHYSDSSHPDFVEYLGKNAFQENNKQIARVDKKGDFEISIPLDHPILSFIWDHSHRKYWFYASPGETVHLTISPNGQIRFNGSGECDKLVMWMSNDCPKHLAFSTSSLTNEEICTITMEDYSAKVEKCMEENLIMAHKVANKKKFSEKETQILITHIRMEAAMSELYFHLLTMARESTKEVRKQRKREASNPSSYRIINTIAPNDLTVFVLPDDMMHLNNMYQFSWLFSSNEKEQASPNEMVSIDKRVFSSDSPSLFIQSILCARPTLENIYESDTELFNHQVKERAEQIQSFYIREKLMSLRASIAKDHQSEYDFPNGDAKKILNMILSRYKGRYVYLDFWGTTCGPCREAIINSAKLRERVSERDDIKLVFVTSEKWSPEPSFTSFSQNHLSTEDVFRMSDYEFAVLSTFFGFNALPHHEVISPNQKILRKPPFSLYHPEEFMDVFDSYIANHKK